MFHEEASLDHPLFVGHHPPQPEYAPLVACVGEWYAGGAAGACVETPLPCSLRPRVRRFSRSP
jgi:hypothetical protein